MKTLFITMFGGADWIEYYDALEEMGGACHIVYLCFIAFLQLSLLNIVTSFFVEQAMKISIPPVLQLAEERIDEERQYAKELHRLFEELDKNQNGFIEREELDHMVSHGTITSYLRFLDIDPTWSKEHLLNVFDEVAEQQPGQGEERVTIKAIVERIMAARGFARSTEINDLVVMLRQVQILQQQMMNDIGRMGRNDDDIPGSTDDYSMGRQDS